MHDPMTVAHEIKYPWKRRPTRFWPDGYRATCVTIWHVDPERDGSDDSCGFTFPRPSISEPWIAKLIDDMRFVCRDHADGLCDQRRKEGRLAWRLLWLQRASFWHRKRGLSARHVSRLLFDESFPGGRDDFWTDRPMNDNDIQRLAYGFAREYLRMIRPWWKHPRWHVWHWRIQIHPVQDFKRWAFSRCAGCGRRFTFGYSPVSHSWNGTGPRWFRGERGVFHSECAHAGPSRAEGVVTH